MKLNKPVAQAIWEALGFPQGWGAFQPDIDDRLHFVVQLPNGIPAEALVAERVGSPGFVAFVVRAAVAGQFSFIRIANDIASGQKLLIDALYVAAANDPQLTIGLPAGAPAGAISAKQIGGAAPPGVTLLSGTSAAPGGTQISQVPAGHFIFSDPYQLDPGTELGLVTAIVNANLTAAFYFRQLPA